MPQKAKPEPTIEHPNPETMALVHELAQTKSQRRVARELGLGLIEFQTHYEDAWQSGRDAAKEGLLAKLLAQGLAGNANAAVKYITLMGMAPPQRVEHTGKDGGPIEHVDLTRLTEEQLQEYGRLSAIAQGLDPADVILVERTDRA